MLEPWRPLGLTDPTRYSVAIIALRNEDQRDAIMMAGLMAPIDYPHMSFLRELRSTAMRHSYRIKLRGGYGLVLALPHGSAHPAFRHAVYLKEFSDRFIDSTTRLCAAAGWPYAWRVSRLSGNEWFEASERTRCGDGHNLRAAIQRDINAIKDGTYREKGVDYAT